jgi:uncharacterized protein (DUF1501 family)
MGITRRDFLKQTAALAAMGMASGWPKLSFANLPTDNRFVLVILRGALDGLAAVAPYGDSSYATLRGGLAFGPPGEENGVIDLNGFFGFNPALAPLHPLYVKKQLAVVHAVASPYRERSHFDAQNLLENGTVKTGGSVGWLNRALGELKAQQGAALAINQQIPLVLQGPKQVASWAPKGGAFNEGSAYMKTLATLYAQDPVLAEPFAEGLRIQQLAASTLTKDDTMSSKNALGPEALAITAKAAGSFLAKEIGPRLAVLEAGGWDTHFRQGTVNGVLATRLADLAKGLALLPATMGPAWDKTVVVVVTEFGRTVRENGTGGSDHGTAGMALVMGGRVNGGKVYGNWPGLGAGKLYQDRDLAPTTDMRSIFKTVLYGHMGATTSGLDSIVFPDSAAVGLMSGLLA